LERTQGAAQRHQTAIIGTALERTQGAAQRHQTAIIGTALERTQGAAQRHRAAKTSIIMNVHRIRFGDEGQDATSSLLRQFERLLTRIPQVASPAVVKLRGELTTLEAIDRQYGGTGALPLEDAGELVAATLTDLARLENDCRHEGEDIVLAIARLTVAVALWAVRHEVALTVAEPVTNALAHLSNAAGSKAELSAIFGVMHGIIGNVAPALEADLERSNPQRPWRLLHVNLAITAVRTEDSHLMELAFDALDGALPDERASFYAEALSLAMGPKVAANVREAIERRHGRFNLS
jgi:hypothetical protein